MKTEENKGQCNEGRINALLKKKKKRWGERGSQG